MQNNKILIIFLIILILTCPALVVYSTTQPLNNVPEPMIRTAEHKYKEADYINAYCNGKIEVQLTDKTRVDCLTDEYAVEFDWGYKWAESIGQALYYAKMTKLKPAAAIIMKSPDDEKYIKRIQAVDKNITIFRIKAYE